jgi:hypothetical protein
MKAAFVTLLVLCVAHPALAGDATVDGLEWLAGYWTITGEDGAIAVEELWLSVAGQVMVGVHRDARNPERVFFEYLRIEARDGGVYYGSKPSNQPEAVFRLTEHEPGARALFENPDHDFPQRIAYTLDGGVLTVTISGIVGAEERSSRWTFTRTAFDKETP